MLISEQIVGSKELEFYDWPSLGHKPITVVREYDQRLWNMMSEGLPGSYWVERSDSPKEEMLTE